MGAFQDGEVKEQSTISRGLVEDKIENTDLFDLFSPGSSVFKFHPKHQMTKKLSKKPNFGIIRHWTDYAIDMGVPSLKRSGMAAKKVSLAILRHRKLIILFEDLD